MKITIIIKCDNAAFGEADPHGRARNTRQSAGPEVARLLRLTADRCEDGGIADDKLRDINGNTVGSVKVTP